MAASVKSVDYAPFTREGFLLVAALEEGEIHKARELLTYLYHEEVDFALRRFSQDIGVLGGRVDRLPAIALLWERGLLDNPKKWLLHLCYHSQERAVSLLLERGCDADSHDTVPEGLSTVQTPLFMAAKSGVVATARALREAGALVDRANYEGRTPLFQAAIHGRGEMAQYLLQVGANPNHQDVYGYTPLHVIAVHDVEAPMENRVWVGQLLVAQGASLEIKDHKGGSARHFWETNFTLVGKVDILDALTEGRILDNCTPPVALDEPLQRL